jgi:hypothetical protein
MRSDARAATLSGMQDFSEDLNYPSVCLCVFDGDAKSMSPE